ncbi:MAG: response regulator transcription factor [Phycisphaerales bacterium]|nr:response regulator transcription factor [Phycisphaerales bacterium]
MTITANLSGEQLRGLTHAAASLARLPAVPTQSWCAEASAAIQHIRSTAFVLVTLLTNGEQGGSGPASVEATGGLAPAASAFHEDIGRIHSDGVGAPGWRVAEALQGERIGAARLRDLSSWSAWSFTAAGKRWKRFGVNDLLIGAGCLHPENPNRVLVVELGAGPEYPPFAQSDAIVLAPILEMVTERAAIAFGMLPVTASSTVTPREEQILQLLTLGCTVREIAERLSRSRHTVHDHVKSLHRKLGATTRGALIARYLGRPTEGSAEERASSPPAIVTKMAASATSMRPWLAAQER